jgi:hypothetical protein
VKSEGGYMKYLLCITITVLTLMGCSPRISNVTHEINFKKGRYKGDIIYSGSEMYLCLDMNTYKGLFHGRETFFSFKKNHYFITFNKAEPSYSEKDIKHFSAYRYHRRDTSFIPEYCRFQTEKITSKRIRISFDFQDKNLPEKLKCRFTLKFKNSSYNADSIFKYFSKK